MDPTANLQRQIRLAASILTDAHDREDNGLELAQLVIDLQKWLSRGGFSPTQHLVSDVLRHVEKHDVL